MDHMPSTWISNRANLSESEEELSNFAAMRSDILRGISAELQQAGQSTEFIVESSRREGDIWKVFVNLASDGRRSGLNDALEGASAWWPGPPKGAADVLSVIPEEGQINLRFTTTDPPKAGGLIVLFPPLYLESLRDCWSDIEWSTRCLSRLKDVYEENNFTATMALDARAFPLLRNRQRSALKLPGWDAAFLWGPPGTGKTFTLGCLLAQYLHQYPDSRILLLSSTNTAVDRALVAVDQALDFLPTDTAKKVRGGLFRVGNRFIASYYKDRRYLLPNADEQLLRQLITLEANRPDVSDVQADDRWKQQIELIRRAIRQKTADVLAGARFAAMTTTLAALEIETLRSYPYDHVVFDEASQVGIAHAAALLPLGRRALFAGDHRQLAPIVQSGHSDAREWLGESMFKYVGSNAEYTVCLNEQSRMASKICRVVADVFYDRDLKVAEDVRQDRAWNKERELFSVPPIGSRATAVIETTAEGQWSQKYHGPIRFESARIVADLVCDLLGRYLDPSNILVLTPFHAQRVLIRQQLQDAGVRSVTISTVHKAQGSECHTVIFDPVQGNSGFLTGPEAKRLVNVAISRAKARIVIILSEGDRNNCLFAEIGWAIQPPGWAQDAKPIGKFISQPGFPDCLIGKTVKIGPWVVTVNDVFRTADGTWLATTNHTKGMNSRFHVPTIVKNFG